MSATDHRDRLVELLEPVVAGAGFDLEDLTVRGAGKTRLLRVVVDRDGGVTLDDTSELSRAVSAALDRSDPMGAGPYTLEVTSPGVDRPLTERRHWHRAADRLVRVPLRGGGELFGRVLSADDSGVHFDVGGTRHTRGYDELGRGKVQGEFRSGRGTERRADERAEWPPDREEGVRGASEEASANERARGEGG